MPPKKKIVVRTETEIENKNEPLSHTDMLPSFAGSSKQPKNTTKISDITKTNQDKIFSFLDELKKPHKCPISEIMIDKDKRGGVCFWDRSPFSTIPIGCPIRYVPKYRSEIISSEITSDKLLIREPEKDINSSGYYETDGSFCSFNCCLAYINDNKHNPYYRDSSFLLKRMYLEIFECNNFKIIPASPWRLLKDYGGPLTIDIYRKNFNRIEYEPTDIIIRKIPIQAPIALVYDEKITL